MRRRTLGGVLIAYGALGLVVLALAVGIGLGLAGRVEGLMARADDTLVAAARATRTAADSFTSVDGSLADAEASADSAATLAREASGTLGGLAIAMELQFLGAQPLLPLADGFQRSRDQASELAETLDTVAGSLSDTRIDVTEIGLELDTLAVEMEALRDAGGEPGATPPLRLFVSLLLVWLAIPAVAAIVAGLALLRRPPVVPPTPVVPPPVA
jgi:hypothetical protein